MKWLTVALLMRREIVAAALFLASLMLLAGLLANVSNDLTTFAPQRNQSGQVDLSRVDLSGIDLSGVDLSNLDLSDVDTSGLDPNHPDLSQLDLSGVDLSGLDLSGIDLSQADLGGLNLQGLTLDDLDLSTLDLSTLDLESLDASRLDLSSLDLPPGVDPDDLDLGSLDASKLDAASLPWASLGVAGAMAAGTVSAATAGGLTGSSRGATPTPGTGATFAPDRDGAGGEVTCVAVFEPYLACAKRLYVLDRITDGHTMVASQPILQRVSSQPSADGTTFSARFEVVLDPDTPTPIYSVAPDQQVLEMRSNSVGARFYIDQNDVYYVQGKEAGRATVTMRVAGGDAYHAGIIPDGLPISGQQEMPQPVRSSIEAWMQSRAWWGSNDLSAALRDSRDFFSGFGEGTIDPSEPDFFTALVESQVGCCRHRAVGFVEVAQALGVEARFVGNEGHAFAEVRLDGQWVRIDLGGCGDYRLENDGKQAYGETASDNQGLFGPDGSSQQGGVATRTRITTWPESGGRDERFQIAGDVRSSGTGLAGAPVILYLNETKSTPGREVARGTTDAQGRFTLQFSMPDDLPPRQYQLVARHPGSLIAGTAYRESWSDPPFSLHDAGNLRLDAPSPVLAGTRITWTATLTDSRSNGLPGRDLEFIQNGSVVMLRTDGRGQAVWRTATEFSAATVRFAGDGHVSAASAEHSVEISDLVFQADAALFEGTLDEPVVVSGNVTSSDGPAAGRTLAYVAWPSDRNCPPKCTGTPILEEEVVADPAGRIEIPFEADPGPYWIQINDRGLALGGATVHVMAPVELSTPWDGRIVPGPGRSVSVQATSLGEPLHGIPITLVGQQTSSNVTDAEGRTWISLPSGTHVHFATASWQDDGIVYAPARLEVTVVEATIQTIVEAKRSSGGLALEVRSLDGPLPDRLFIEIAGDRHALPDGQATIPMATDGEGAMEYVLTSAVPGHREVGSLTVPAPAPGPSWLMILAVVAILGLAAAVSLAVRWSIRSGRLDRRRQGTVQVSIDGRENLPLAVAPGTSVTLRVACQADGEPLRQGRVRVQVDGRSHRARIRQGTAKLQLHDVRGVWPLQVRATAWWMRPVHWQGHLRGVSWSQQVRIDYDELAARHADGLPEGFTPRMLQTVASSDPDTMEAAMAVYEAAIYSPRDVDELDWLRFVQGVAQ